LPPPEFVARFNEVVPNGAERIFRMAENEQSHRIAIEGNAQHAAIRESKRGQWLGALISLSAIAGAVYSVYVGAHWSVPIALVGVPVLGIVKAIVDSRSSPKG
jgi:uncharacterized membrane protein